ncbi:hypothetical protein KL938_004232 [Ogataea parapolymorpha]|nr:hypothetical protein KL938_004232 [Ogataea parapolymorpha]
MCRIVATFYQKNGSAPYGFYSSIDVENLCLVLTGFIGHQPYTEALYNSTVNGFNPSLHPEKPSSDLQRNLNSRGNAASTLLNDRSRFTQFNPTYMKLDMDF